MIYEMGNNLCFPGQKGLPRPPRDLGGFLRDVVEQENQGEGKENRNGLSWEQEFRRYLEKNQTDLLVYLEFILETEKLIILGEEEKDGNPTRKRTEEIRSTKLQILRSIGEKYFTTESGLALSNQVLLEEAGTKLRELTPADLEDGVRLVLAARSDYKVWKSGLDNAYRNFLASDPTPPLQAVLLSIL